MKNITLGDIITSSITNKGATILSEKGIVNVVSTVSMNNLNPSGFQDASGNIKITYVFIDIVIHNSGTTNNLTIRRNDTNSDPDNRFDLDVNATLEPKETATFFYNPIKSRWVLESRGW